MELGLSWPFNKAYVHAKNGVNDHGPFVRGSAARGAYPADLVQGYLQCGVLVAAPAQGQSAGEG
ncbi:MAG: hypothetical protein ACRCWC_03760 [Plesiomonas shigelloides]